MGVHLTITVDHDFRPVSLDALRERCPPADTSEVLANRRWPVPRYFIDEFDDML